MDPETRLNRHTQLWEAGNTSVRRTALSAVIFASVVLFNVIRPHAEIAPTEAALTNLQENKLDVTRQLQQTLAVEQALSDMTAIIEAAPWSHHKDALINLFASTRVADPQVAADQTVRDIAAQVRSEVVNPLKAAVTKSGVTGPLATLPKEMDTVVTNWVNSKIQNRWFRTIEQKERTIIELGDAVEKLRAQALSRVNEMKTQVTARRSDLDTRQADIGRQITTAEATIKAALNEALPVWAKGLVTVKGMVGLYPWILIGLALYLVGSAIRAARHYRGMADAHGWTADERSDPLLSSTWTLTWRGAIGTAVTLGCYTAVLLCLWYCLHESARGAQPWLTNGLMALTLITVIAAPLFGRKVPAAS